MAFETYRALIAELAAARGYDAAVLAAQIWQESRFNPMAVSPAGARGLMQFMPKTWEWARTMGWVPRGANINDPGLNIQAGIRYMQWLLTRYRAATHPLQLALAGYNCGQGNVDKAISSSGRSDWDGVKPFLPAETRDYVPKIMNRIATYRAVYGAAKAALPGVAIGLIAILVTLLLRRGISA